MGLRRPGSETLTALVGVSGQHRIRRPPPDVGVCDPTYEERFRALKVSHAFTVPTW